MKQETLEEAAEIDAIKRHGIGYHPDVKKPFISGAKWQEERSYSEEEVLTMLLIKHDGLTPEYVLEQFKKK